MKIVPIVPKDSIIVWENGNPPASAPFSHCALLPHRCVQVESLFRRASPLYMTEPHNLTRSVSKLNLNESWSSTVENQRTLGLETKEPMVDEKVQPPRIKLNYIQRRGRFTLVGNLSKDDTRVEWVEYDPKLHDISHLAKYVSLESLLTPASPPTGTESVPRVS